MMILSFFTTVIILAVVLNSSSNGFQSLVVRMARPAAQDHRPRNALAVFSAIAPLSGNTTASSSSSCWVPSNGFRVEEDEDSAADGVKDSTSAAATVSSSSLSASVHSSTAARLQKKKKNKIAVILNMNARGVTESTAETVRKVLSASNNGGRVFVTRTSQEALDAVNEIISSSEDDAASSSYELVIPVGGDGTLTTVINCLVSAIRKQQQQQQLNSTTTCTVAQAIRQMPVLGYIPLGTGNGVGPVVGCKLKRRFRRRKQKEEIESLLATLQKASESFNAINDDGTDSTASSTIVKLPIMEVTVSNEKKNENVLCFFAGVGFDSLMLNDYKKLQSWSQQTGILTNFLSSVKGYCVALILKTLPAAILKDRHNIQVKVTCPDPEQALWIDHRRGDFVQTVTNTTLYEGKTGILAAGTAPFYGGGLRLFPFARMTLDKMHLRLGRIHPATGFFNIPSIFAGSYRDTSDRFGVLDFMLTDVDVQVSTPKGSDEKGFPFQHSGESVGLVERFHMRVVDEPVRFVCLRKQR